jgi:hypothetical protein
MKSRKEEPFVDKGSGLLKLRWRRESHWLHYLDDQPQQRTPVLLPVLRRRNGVEEPLPLCVARIFA